MIGHAENQTAETADYLYDEHGNMTKMPHLQEIIWDYADKLREVELNADGNTAYYNYDYTGNRVRKVIDKGNIKEVRKYVENAEFFTKFVNSVEDTKIETLHAMQRNPENSSANVNTAIIDTVLLQGEVLPIL